MPRHATPCQSRTAGTVVCRPITAGECGVLQTDSPLILVQIGVRDASGLSSLSGELTVFCETVQRRLERECGKDSS
ncbi:hypothetical protein E2C01_063645 [Portunus trituberculatus]|uniref:Uncharacterized protein n=1 Tax=Portunus trituberculatus TaxID=210409 RepID=A0A5B7HE85_PORTR|nr:hypothetical protein [Portunus trituberculatus]